GRLTGLPGVLKWGHDLANAARAALNETTELAKGADELAISLANIEKQLGPGGKGGTTGAVDEWKAALEAMANLRAAAEATERARAAAAAMHALAMREEEMAALHAMEVAETEMRAMAEEERARELLALQGRHAGERLALARETADERLAFALAAA